MAVLGTIKYCTIHCSADREDTKKTAKDLNAWDIKKFGQKSYHFIIEKDGTLIANLSLNLRGAHVGGHNTGNIGVCYVGGLGLDGRAKDTRTRAQKTTMEKLVKELRGKYPNIIFKGHRDWSPDKDKDGKIEPFEWLKSCPCFEVSEFIKTIN